MGMPSVLKQKLNRSIDEQVSLLEIQLTPECKHQLEKMIALGIRRMIVGKSIDRPAKRMTAEQNFIRFIEKLINQSKDLGVYPVIDDRVYEVALLETGSLWPFRTGG